MLLPLFTDNDDRNFVIRRVSECDQLCFTDDDDQNVVIRRVSECDQLCFTDDDDQTVVIRRVSECHQHCFIDDDDQNVVIILLRLPPYYYHYRQLDRQILYNMSTKQI